ncbi:hypothetical protein RvY_05346 [Ramazzottius varieornatus]|uniref:SLC25A26 n=1 Tax=Ramazzottius varieornatus TaxID=947166 RepID=A0A1D1V1F1_RAMVA|nr:hypothetical protein RvY_05346 [Ramazzottius varieornatus]
MDSEVSQTSNLNAFFVSSLLAGAAAGVAVDLTLFPLDTVKTRLQSQLGFWKAGGFSKLYAGIGSTLLGSAPTAALFFCAYESTKAAFRASNTNPSTSTLAFHHIFSAIVGEVAACLIRVPVENVKQRSQALQRPSTEIYKSIVHNDGYRGFYRGFSSTIFREIPFAVIQFPLWEFLKHNLSQSQHGHIHSWQSAVCGSVSGAIAAALTTPLDVVKTRIMLAERTSMEAKGNVASVFETLWREEGVRSLFAGVGPRTAWISVGGFIFLGMYDKMSTLLRGTPNTENHFA